MRKGNIPIKKVQKAFSDAIKRRDRRCMIRDFECCCGGLECSHFFTQGSAPSLMFYPDNAYAQCSRHHWNHHNKLSSKNVYADWLDEHKSAELFYMASVRNRYIKYTDELKAEIIKLCNADKLIELKELIKAELEYGF